MKRGVADMQAKFLRTLGGNLLAKRSKALRELGLFLILKRAPSCHSAVEWTPLTSSFVFQRPWAKLERQPFVKFKSV